MLFCKEYVYPGVSEFLLSPAGSVNQSDTWMGTASDLQLLNCPLFIDSLHVFLCPYVIVTPC
jgi:hypothetical protein